MEASRGAFAATTERALHANLKIFAEWCLLERRDVLPTRTQAVVAFIDAMSHSKVPATVRWYITSITELHRTSGVANLCGEDEVCFALREMHWKAA